MTRGGPAWSRISFLKAVGAFRAARMDLACLQADAGAWNDNTTG